MALLIVLLLIPLSFAGSPPNCGELGTILESYEKDLQKKFITDCRKIDYKTMVQDIPVKDPEFLNGKMCSDLATIETELERLKLEEAVLSGINKLKKTVQESKEQTEKTSGRVAAMSFVSSLNAAQSLEVLLQSTTDDGTPIIQKLKAFPDNQRLTQKDLSDRITEICKANDKEHLNNKFVTDVDVCNPNVFKPNPEAAAEILQLVKTSEPSIEQISKWQRMLTIRRKSANPEDTAYSFNDMQNELSGAFAKLDSKDVLSKEHIKAIAKLDDFENPPGLSFVEDISSIKDQKKAKIASDKFFLLMGDAKLRGQYEVQSKLSIVYDDVKNLLSDLTESQKADCSNAKNLYKIARSCYQHIEGAHKNLTGDAKANLGRFLPALKSSIDYADALENKEESCREELKTKDALSESCYGEFNRDHATVQDQILQLNLLKDKIGAENIEAMKFRNFALMKWGSQKCQTLASSMDMCEDDTLITKEAVMTFSDAMKIAVVFSPKPEAEQEAEKICDEDRKFKKHEERLCEFFNDTVSDVVKPSKKEDVDGPVQAPDGGNEEAKIRDAWIQGGTGLLTDVLRHYVNQQQQRASTVNPYPYNYSPWNNGARPMGISDTILFNARYHGAYGFYMPTPGYQPYTAFGNASLVSPYQSVSTSASKYFGR